MFEKENTDHGNHMINAQPSFSKKRCFQHVFRPHETELGIDRRVFNFLRFVVRFEKFRFGDRLVWTVGLTMLTEKQKCPFNLFFVCMEFIDSNRE